MALVVAESGMKPQAPSSGAGVVVVLDPEEWAKSQMRGVDLGDKRLNRRAVEMAARMAANPQVSLPNQMEYGKALKGAYGLLNNKEVTMEALLAPQCGKTLEMASQAPLVLLVEDITELDYTKHGSKSGLGPIGDGKGRGLVLHSTMAVTPEERQVLGMADARVVLRQSRSGPRVRHNTPESQLWEASVEKIGSPPEGVTWVHVSDREGDIFEHMAACVDGRKHFLLRVYQNRALSGEEAGNQEGKRYLMEYARSMPAYAGGGYSVLVPARKGQPAREAQVEVAWEQVTIRPPRNGSPELRQHAPITVWLLRVWEPQAPQGVEPLEWILLCSLPITTLAETYQRIKWYACRWLCEDYHQCLKTGCGIEQTQLDDGADIMRLLGFCCPIAVRLLQLRQIARKDEQLPAREVTEPLMVQVLGKVRKRDWQTMTIGEFWREVAAMGGYLGRKSDGPPGWRTLWRGMVKLLDLTEGARLFAGQKGTAL